MHPSLVSSKSASHGVPVWGFARGQSIDTLPDTARNWLEATGFEYGPGQVLPVPAKDGSLAGVILGVEPSTKPDPDPFLYGALPRVLPAGVYRLEGPLSDPRLNALGFVLGCYQFDRYTSGDRKKVQLVLPSGVDGKEITAVAEAVFMARDLVNTPTNDMGPSELEAAVCALGTQHYAQVGTILGDDLLTQNFPMIHAVGRASASAPRLIDLTWGDPAAPKVTLVGKGVCFDTGGLDIKPESSMLLMKKDMGGAAMVLAVAHMVMSAKLPVRLRVLIPAVENSISANSFRPGDVLKSRKGLTVEIGNTDAEGRLVLADALTLADEEAPDLLLDFATLTGAARVALGPDIPPFFTHDDALAADLSRHAGEENDPLWRLPLWRPYEAMLKTPIADLNNVGKGGHAGAITAALFLSRFVEKARAHAHFDVFAWNPNARPGRPAGAEAQAARAVFGYLRGRYGKGG